MSSSSPSAIRLPSIACLIALRSTSSPKGLVRNSTAPAFMALTVVGTSPYPVMNMIEMPPSWDKRFCRSKPLRSGRLTSSTRQLGVGTRGQARNSCADANVSTCQPTWRMSSSSDSRTETSSSTTNTMGLVSDTNGPGRGEVCSWMFIVFPLNRTGGSHSAQSERLVERLEQSAIAERLAKTGHSAALDEAQRFGFACMRRDEDDRNLVPATLQFPLEVGSGHAGQCDIEDQTFHLADAVE